MADLIIGRNACLEALKGNRKIYSLTLQKLNHGGRNRPDGDRAQGAREKDTGTYDGPLRKIIDEAQVKGIPIEYVDRNTMDKMAAGIPHQGVIAKAEDYRYSNPEEIVAFAEEKGETPFLVLLDGIEDPHNLGAIIRTAECAGAHGVVFPKNRSAAVNETVLRTSAGAAEFMKCAQVTNLARTIEDLKEKGVWIYACDMGGQEIWKTDLSGAVALVIGSEGKGVSRLVRERSDGIVSLPMFGSVGSLNASNAAAVAMYEVVRQRRGR